jgi:hypothetical protein
MSTAGAVGTNTATGYLEHARSSTASELFAVQCARFRVHRFWGRLCCDAASLRGDISLLWVIGAGDGPGCTALATKPHASSGSGCCGGGGGSGCCCGGGGGSGCCCGSGCGTGDGGGGTAASASGGGPGSTSGTAGCWSCLIYSVGCAGAQRRLHCSALVLEKARYCIQCILIRCGPHCILE